MKYIFLLIISSFFISCASHEKTNMVSTPYESYKSYRNSLKDKNYKYSVSMLSKKIKNEYDPSNDFNESFPFFSSIDTVVTREIVYYQKTYDSKSCLTINGYNLDGEPTTLNFELLKESNSWKFSYVQMMYHDSDKEKPSSVMCPQKPNN